MANETEEQQLAELKKWWSENGTSIIFGIAFGLACVFGFRGWQGYQAGLSEKASSVYSIMLKGLQQDDRQIVSERAKTLITEYSSTPYAALAALSLANIHTREGNMEAANAQLRWALENGDTDTVRDTAHLRLVHVLIEQGSLDEAEAMLNQPRTTTAFDNFYIELAGDIHRVRDNAAGASEAYQRALAATPVNSPGYHMLQLKYEDSLANSNVGDMVQQ